MEIRMKPSNLILLLIAVGFSFSFADKSSVNKNSTETSSKKSQEFNSSTKPMKKNFNIRQRQPEHLITPDQTLIIEPRVYYSQFAEEGSAISHMGLPIRGNGRQNIHLTDLTGKYDVKIQNLHRGMPSNFQAALRAISAHILNQKNGQEYIPYPPNGDPYNYPAYRGHPRATEPPVVRAYERASNSNYDIQPADFDQEDHRRFLTPNGDYQSGFPNQFQNFGQGGYNPLPIFNDGAFYSEPQRDSYPVHESQWYIEGENLRKPIK